MSITAAEFRKKMDEFIVKVGGTKEEVVYQINPARIHKGTRLFDCKEISSKDITPGRKKNLKEMRNK